LSRVGEIDGPLTDVEEELPAAELLVCIGFEVSTPLHALIATRPVSLPEKRSVNVQLDPSDPSATR
jgi:hypothetical protein